MASPDLAAVGGALGRHASARARSLAATAVPLAGLSVLTVLVAFYERGYCVSNGWDGPSQFWRACYSDLPTLYAGGDLASGLSGYLGEGTGQVAQPVLSGGFLALLGGLVPDGSLEAQTRWFFILVALATVVLVATTVWAVAATRPSSPGLAAHVALAPVVVTATLVSVDALAVALSAYALLAWSRRHPALAGALLGLAVAARTYALVVVLALALLTLRTGAGHALRRVLGGAAIALAVVALPFLVASPGRLTTAYADWWATPVGLGSPWLLPQLAGIPLAPALVNGLTVVGMLLAVVAAAWLALSAPRRPSVAEVALVALTVVLLTSKTYPVQAALWLVPLVALCGLRWWEHLPWALTEVTYFVAVWLYLGASADPDRGLPVGWYFFFLVFRLAGVGWLLARLWRRAHEPLPPEGADTERELDGVLADEPDRLVVRVA